MCLRNIGKHNSEKSIYSHDEVSTFEQTVCVNILKIIRLPYCQSKQEILVTGIGEIYVKL